MFIGHLTRVGYCFLYQKYTMPDVPHGIAPHAAGLCFSASIYGGSPSHQKVSVLIYSWAPSLWPSASLFMRFLTVHCHDKAHVTLLFLLPVFTPFILFQVFQASRSVILFSEHRLCRPFFTSWTKKHKDPYIDYFPQCCSCTPRGWY